MVLLLYFAPLHPSTVPFLVAVASPSFVPLCTTYIVRLLEVPLEVMGVTSIISYFQISRPDVMQ